MNPNPPQSYLSITPHLCWLKKYEMKPGKKASSEGTIFCGKHNAITAARNEIDRRGLACLICSHRRHSGEGLPTGPQLLSVLSAHSDPMPCGLTQDVLHTHQVECY